MDCGEPTESTEPILSILGGRAVVLKGVFVDTGVCVIAPLTNAPFAVVEDTNGNATDEATPVPENKTKRKLIL